jgi:hypothetical protein
MILSRQRLVPLAGIAGGALLVYAILAAAWHARAHAAEAVLEAVPTVNTNTGVTIEVILLGLIALFSAARTILAFIAPRTATTKDDRALASIDELLLILRGGRNPVPLPPATPPAQPPSSQAGFVRMGALAVMAMVGLGLAIGSCGAGPAVRAKATVGAGAFLACEEPNVAALATDMVPFVVATIKSWISGDGHPDRAGIKHSAAKIATMAGQCAWDAAMAILTTPAAAMAGAPASAPEAVDVAALRSSWAGIRAELAWAPVAP